MDMNQEAYYLPGDDGMSPCEVDLLYGKLSICQVPLKHRTRTAYIYAMRYARDGCKTPQTAYREKKLIEFQLLSDLTELCRTKDPRYEEMRYLYDSYYNPDGLNIFNSVGVSWDVYAEHGFTLSEDGTMFSFDMKNYGRIHGLHRQPVPIMVS